MKRLKQHIRIGIINRKGEKFLYFVTIGLLRESDNGNVIDKPNWFRRVK